MHAHRLGWLTSMLALFCSTAAQAWGPAAHRIVAQLAEGQLQADARVKVRQLLTLSDARHLSVIANCAGDLREDPDQREFLGMEAIWKIEVEDFPAFILIDDKGNDFFQSVGPGCSVKH